MRLFGGPAHGHQIPAPRDGWAWVDATGDELRVYDLDKRECEQYPDRRIRGGWAEYILDDGVLRYSRKTPVREG